ncbi:MAG TPA: amino acid permease [Candidatus Obscuribacterales bacterium]
MTSLSCLFRRKPIGDLTGDDAEGSGLHRALSFTDIFLFGIACIIGAGIFVLTGQAAAQHAGPAISLSFLAAAVVCGFVGLAYAELASMIPVAGSAYSYTYATLGECIAWIIGADLLLEYGLGASAVSVSWSAYFQHVLEIVGISVPAALAHAPDLAAVPWLSLAASLSLCIFGAVVLTGFCQPRLKALETKGAPGYLVLSMLAAMLLTLSGAMWSWTIFADLPSINLLAASIMIIISAALSLGVRESQTANNVFVVLKLAVIVLLIAVGLPHINTDNYVPFFPDLTPEDWTPGWLAGAAVVFFAFIGFDSVSTTAEEARNPQKDLPRGMLASLAVCTLLYIAVSLVMTGVVAYKNLGVDAPVATVLAATGHVWAVQLASLGALCGLTSVLMSLAYGQSRIMMRMSRDGLFPPVFGEIHKRFKTPAKAIWILGFIMAVLAAIVPLSELALLVNIGTLAAFILVCAGVIILRRHEPNAERRFRCPWVPTIPVLGILGCLSLIATLNQDTWLRFVLWMVLSIAVYALYGRRHSKLEPQYR